MWVGHDDTVQLFECDIFWYWFLPDTFKTVEANNWQQQHVDDVDVKIDLKF